jgi:hypothetical protein
MDPAIAPLGAIRGDKWCSGQEDDKESWNTPITSHGGERCFLQAEIVQLARGTLLRPQRQGRRRLTFTALAAP